MNPSLKQAPGQARKQRGFALGYVLLAIGLIAVVVAAIARSNQSPTPQATTETARIQAATLIKLASDLRDAASRYAVNADINTMTLDKTTTGLYQPALALAMQVDPPVQVFASAAAATPFVLDKTNIVVTDAGTAAAEIALTLPGLTDASCRAINSILYGVAVTVDPPTAPGARMEGCFSAAASGGGAASNTYFKVVQPV